MNSLARRILRRFGAFRSKPSVAVTGISDLVAAHSEIVARKPKDVKADNIIGVIFSMDRALQLHALLGSYKDQVSNPAALKIIYRASSESHESAYQDVFEAYSGMISVIRQDNREEFKGLVLDALAGETCEHVFFLVDDNLFIEPVDLTSASTHSTIYCIPSFRMGQNLSRSYVVDRSQSLPLFMPLSPNEPEDMLAWAWSQGKLDWNYPLSVDGHIFLREEILAITKCLNFDSPNRYEEQLQKFHSAFSWRLGVCYSKSRLINIPYNKVQTDIENLHGSVHQDDMLRMWNEEHQIDRKSYYGIVNESAHQELPLRLTKRAEFGQG